MIERKSILIFGAGVNQIELIREAKKLGLMTVAIDPTDFPPGRDEADFFYTVAAYDYEKTKYIAIKHKVDGIVTGQMEKPLRIMAKLAEELGFVFHSPSVVERCIDKWLMKQTLLKASVPCANGILLKANDPLSDLLTQSLTFPLIIKPRDSFSSRGVYKTDSFEELSSFLNETRSYSSTGDVIIEEFLKGKEYSVETITYQGRTNIIQITEKFISPFPNTVEIEHLQPADLGNNVVNKIQETVINAINSLGVNNSAAHVEVMVTENKVSIIEVGARLGGDFISSYLTRSSTGVSMDKAAIQVSIGMQPEIDPSKKNFSLVRYLIFPPNKKVKEIKAHDFLFNNEDIVFAHVFLKVGDITQPVTHSALRPACFIVKAETKERLLLLADDVEKLLAQTIVFNN